MNNHERSLARRRRAENQARSFGWTGPFSDLPEDTQNAFLRPEKANRLGGSSDESRKGFSRSPLAPPQYRGSHLNRSQLRQRAQLRIEWAEGGIQPQRNKHQRELGRFLKRPRRKMGQGLIERSADPSEFYVSARAYVE